MTLYKNFHSQSNFQNNDPHENMEMNTEYGKSIRRSEKQVTKKRTNTYTNGNTKYFVLSPKNNVDDTFTAEMIVKSDVIFALWKNRKKIRHQSFVYAVI